MAGSHLVAGEAKAPEGTLQRNLGVVAGLSACRWVKMATAPNQPGDPTRSIAPFGQPLSPSTLLFFLASGGFGLF